MLQRAVSMRRRQDPARIIYHFEPPCRFQYLIAFGRTTVQSHNAHELSCCAPIRFFRERRFDVGKEYGRSRNESDARRDTADGGTRVGEGRSEPVDSARITCVLHEQNHRPRRKRHRKGTLEIKGLTTNLGGHPESNDDCNETVFSNRRYGTKHPIHDMSTGPSRANLMGQVGETGVDVPGSPSFAGAPANEAR